MASAGSLFVQLALDSTRYAAGLSETTKKTNETVRKIQRELRGMVNFAIGAGGFYAIVRGFKAVTAAAAEQEEATLRLSQTLKNYYQFTYGNIRALDAQASALQKVTRYSNETTMAAMSQLMAVGKLDVEGIRKIIPAIQDFAIAWGKDLVSAAELVGKALGSQTNSLKRYGIQLDMTKTGVERLNELLRALNAAYRGQAQVEGYATSIIQLKNAIKDLNEEIGFMIIGKQGGILKEWAQIISGFSGRMAKVRREQEWWQMNLPGEKPAGKLTAEGIPITFYTEEQRLRAESIAAAYEAYQTKVNLIRKEKSVQLAAEQVALDERAELEEAAGKESLARAEKLEKEWTAILEKESQLQYDEVMSRRDVWDEMSKDREEAARKELEMFEYRAGIESDWYERQSQAGQRAWENFQESERKAVEESQRHFIQFGNTLESNWERTIYCMIDNLDLFSEHFKKTFPLLYDIAESFMRTFSTWAGERLFAATFGRILPTGGATAAPGTFENPAVVGGTPYAGKRIPTELYAPEPYKPIPTELYAPPVFDKTPYIERFPKKIYDVWDEMSKEREEAAYAGKVVYVNISGPSADQIISIVDSNMRNNGILRR